MTSTAVARPRMDMGTLTDPRELGTVLAASGYFNDARDAAQAVVKVLAGAELGFGPIASMTGVYIVKGRVTLSANLMAAAIKRHPKYDYRVKNLTDTIAEVSFFESGQEIGSSEFTMDDAKRAGLAGGENWRKYPRNMLLWRAMSNGAKFYCPDAFSGAPVYTPDELGADVDPETGELLHGVAVEIPPAPPAPTPPAREDVSAMAQASAPPVMSAAERMAENDVTLRHGGAPEPEPAPAVVASPEPPEDPAAQVTEAEVAKLREVLDAVNAPETFWRMALMSYGVDDLANLTRGQALEVAEKATARFGA